MIIHYIKVAWRNLLRYKTQSIISIMGLAVGFTCFALATLWLRYEMTYDSFHAGSDRMYMLYDKSNEAFGSNRNYPPPLANQLKAEFPEIEVSCPINHFREWEYKTDDERTYSILTIKTDSCFLQMFDIRLLSGTMDFLNDDGKIAVTQETALRLFGQEDPLGKVLKDEGKELTICAVVQGWGEHTIIPYGIMKGIFPVAKRSDWTYNALNIWVRLKKETDVEAFREKLYQYEKKIDDGINIRRLQLMPITQCRYEFYAWDLPVQFHYLKLFSLTGGLIILCALFNYLSLFASRLRIRIREMALRTVCGSSYGRLYALLCTEFVMILCFSCLLGLVFIEICLPTFLEYTKIKGGVYAESLLYFATLALLAMLAFGLVLNHFNRRVFRQALKGATDKRSQQFFHRSSLVLQMSIGLLLIFCVGIILKQIYYLKSVDVGMERKNIVMLQLGFTNKSDAVANHIGSIPCVSEMLTGLISLFPQRARMSMCISDWEDKQPADEPLDVECVNGARKMFDFYKLRLLKGEVPSADGSDAGKVMINETAALKFGWKDPIGKSIFTENGHRLTVMGLVKDFHQTSPTTPVQPIIFQSANHNSFGLSNILMKYQTGQWKPLQAAVDSVMKQNFPDIRYELVNAEEEYEGFLKSEDALLKLLSFVAVVCILISAFGIYSFVTLTCERRRKEIAIRKVNGAKVSHILLIFLKEYTLLLLIASTIAFSVGYVLMKRWLESYVEQTAISWWVYASIFAGIAGVVVFSIGSRVWKAARQNPAEVIKSE